MPATITRHSDGRWRAEKENRWRILTDRAVCFPVAAALSYTAPGCCVKWGRLTSAILHISRMSIWGIGQKSTGYINCYAPGARVYHVGSATTGTRYNEKKVFLAARNSMYLIYKNMPFLQLLINLPLILSGILIKSLFFLKKGFAGEYLRGIGAGITGCRRMQKSAVLMEKSGELRAHTAGFVGQCDPDSGRKINLIVKQIFKKY